MALRGYLSRRPASFAKGRERSVDAEALVPGILVRLGGKLVPADARILSAQIVRGRSRVDQRVLAGGQGPNQYRRMRPYPERKSARSLGGARVPGDGHGARVSDWRGNGVRTHRRGPRRRRGRAYAAPGGDRAFQHSS